MEIKDQLSVDISMDLIILLLYAKGKSGKDSESVFTITRLQKMIFLMNQGQGPKELVKIAKKYEYEAYRGGPFCDQLRDDLEELFSADIINEEDVKYFVCEDGDSQSETKDDPYAEQMQKQIKSKRFSLSNRIGMEIGSKLWKNLNNKNQKALIEFKSYFNSLPLRQLLIYIYEKHPDYTHKRAIEKSLGLA